MRGRAIPPAVTRGGCRPDGNHDGDPGRQPAPPPAPLPTRPDRGKLETGLVGHVLQEVLRLQRAHGILTSVLTSSNLPLTSPGQVSAVKFSMGAQTYIAPSS